MRSIIIEGKLTIEGDQNNFLEVHNDANQSLVLDFKDKQSLLYFLGALPKRINLLKQQKEAKGVLPYLDQEVVVKVNGKRAIYRKANSNEFVLWDNLGVAISIFWLYVKRSIYRLFN